MSAVHELLVRVERHGAHLVATPPDKVKVVGKPLPAELVEQLRAHKSDLFTLLMRHERSEYSWADQDWLDCFEERAAILEYDAGHSRAEAERQSLAHVIALWLNSHPPKPASEIYGCVRCGQHVSCESGVPLAIPEFTHGAWVHNNCIESFHAYQRAEALDALRRCGVPAPTPHV